MKKKLKNLDALFNGKALDVNVFNKSLKAMLVKGQSAFSRRIYLLAFSSWTELSGKEQKFIVGVVENDR